MTADMAIRLSRVFKTTPDIWMNLQKAVELRDAAQANKNQYAKAQTDCGVRSLRWACSAK